jgi:hypothetical protein
VNLRKDHYCSPQRPAVGAIPRRLLARWGSVSYPLPLWYLFVPPRVVRPAGVQRNPKPVVYCLSELANVKTFNNGSLGSGIDEERSEMR